MLKLQCNENGFKTGQLCFSKSFLPNKIKARPSFISIVPAFAKERKAVENFITDIYARSYGAKINIYYPVLLSISDEHGVLLAATGFRPAQQEQLFLEQYLQEPIDAVLNTPRKKIVEIGNLASDGGGASLYLFAALATYLYNNGYEQAVVTSTGFLEKRFSQMGLQPKRLAIADPALLISQDENWGTYYDTQPRVISGSIEEGYKSIRRRLGIKYHACHPRLFQRLHYRDTSLDTNSYTEQL